MTTEQPCDKDGFPFHPRTDHLTSILLRLGELRNEMDKETFLGDQAFRAALYPLNDAVEAMESAVQYARTKKEKL